MKKSLSNNEPERSEDRKTEHKKKKKKKGLSEKLNRKKTETGGIVLGKYNVHVIFFFSLQFNFQSIPEKSY